MELLKVCTQQSKEKHDLWLQSLMMKKMMLIKEEEEQGDLLDYFAVVD
jgi:hypothetical protein